MFGTNRTKVIPRVTHIPVPDTVADHRYVDVFAIEESLVAAQTRTMMSIN